MPLRKTAVRRKAQVGPRIVRAWFDTVVNPIIRALETEQQLLVEKNWTWRFRPVMLESIRPIRAYVDVEARDNLEQFRELYPVAARRMDDHDRLVSDLSQRCAKLRSRLSENRELRELYHRITSAGSLTALNVSVSQLFGAYPQEDRLALLAEHIVNHTGDLPPYSSTAPLWNQHKEALLALRESRQAVLHYRAVTAAASQLQREDELLERLLKETRLRLSLDHDVPYVAGAKLLEAVESV